MKFFVAKMTYHNGDISYPISLFASDLDSAAQRLSQETKRSDVLKLEVKECPVDLATSLRSSTTPDDTVREHFDYQWWSDY